MDTAGDGTDLCELCGGEARPTRIAIRRRPKTGKNFDLIARCDMGLLENQLDFIQYLRKNNVLLVTMAPNCRSCGPTSHLNKQINYDTWNDHYQGDRKHAKFLVTWQRSTWKRVGTSLENILIRPPFGKSTRGHELSGIQQSFARWLINVGLARLAQMDNLVKKPTVLIGNSETIMSQFDDLRCTGHSHYLLFASSHTDSIKVWPWELAGRLIEGVIQLKRTLSRSIFKYTNTAKDTPAST